MKKELMKKSKKFLHDHLFKEVYSKPRHCVDILKLVLSKKEMALFDWNTLKTEATTFIDKSASEKRMDLLVSALLKGSRKPAKVLFLMEHKSQQDPELLRKFLIYQTGIYKDVKDPVLPIFINQSPHKTWKGPVDFHGFLNNFEAELKKHFKENVLNFRPRVLNIQALDIDRKAKGLTTRPILYILKNIWNLNEKKLRELFTISRGLSQKEREALIMLAVDYVRRYDQSFTWNIIQEIESKTVGKGELIMTPLLQSSLDEAREEGMSVGMRKGRLAGKKEGMSAGMEKGRQEGRQERDKEVILNMLKEKANLAFISKVTGLSVKKLKKLKNGNSE